MDDGGVVTLAEDAADGGIAVVRQFPGEVHGDLAGRDERSGPTRPANGLDGEAVAGGRGVEDHLGRDAAWFAGQDEVREELLGLGEGDRLVVELGEGADAGEGALELPDVVLHVRGDELEDVVGDVDHLILVSLRSAGHLYLDPLGSRLVTDPFSNEG